MGVGFIVIAIELLAVWELCYWVLSSVKDDNNASDNRVLLLFPHDYILWVLAGC